MAKTVKEYKDDLLQLGFNSDEINSLSKGELKDTLEAALKSTTTLESAEIINDGEILSRRVSNIDVEDDSPDVNKLSKRPTDPDWTDFVLDQFLDSELDHGMPKADGLRRVSELLLGTFSSISTVEQVPTIENGGRATVVVNLHFKNGWQVSGAADVFSGNTAKEFAVHAVATAETRAEGRALRKALRLTKILTAEELQGADPDEANGTDKRILKEMLNGLNMMCSQLGVDLLKVAIVMGYNVEVPDDLTHKQGLNISDQLAKYRRDKENIPNAVKA